MMKNQYEHISNDFKNARQMPVTAYLEAPSVIQAVMPINDQSVIDFACGEGFYTRIWKKLGAKNVVGIDLSPEMISLASQQEKNNPIGIRYIVADASIQQRIGLFDIATAVFLFNYANDDKTLSNMIKNIFLNLEHGGRLIAVVPNPDFMNNRTDTLPYGYYLEEVGTNESNIKVKMTFTGDKPFSIKFTQWSKISYENKLTEAGFSEVGWGHFSVSDEGIKKFGSDFWLPAIENPKSIILTAVKKKLT